MEWFKKLDIKIKIVLIALVCLIFATGTFFVVRGLTNKKEKPEPVINYNKNEEILKDREIQGISIHDITLQTVDGQSNYRAKATNKTDAPIEFNGIAITLYKDGEEIGTIEMYPNRTLQPGETVDIVNFNDMNLNEATSVKLELVGE